MNDTVKPLIERIILGPTSRGRGFNTLSQSWGIHNDRNYPSKFSGTIPELNGPARTRLEIFNHEICFEVNRNERYSFFAIGNGCYFLGTSFGPGSIDGNPLAITYGQILTPEQLQSIHGRIDLLLETGVVNEFPEDGAALNDHVNALQRQHIPRYKLDERLEAGKARVAAHPPAPEMQAKIDKLMQSPDLQPFLTEPAIKQPATTPAEPAAPLPQDSAAEDAATLAPAKQLGMDVHDPIPQAIFGPCSDGRGFGLMKRSAGTLYDRYDNRYRKHYPHYSEIGMAEWVALTKQERPLPSEAVLDGVYSFNHNLVGTFWSEDLKVDLLKGRDGYHFFLCTTIYGTHRSGNPSPITYAQILTAEQIQQIDGRVDLLVDLFEDTDIPLATPRDCEAWSRHLEGIMKGPQLPTYSLAERLAKGKARESTLPTETREAIVDSLQSPALRAAMEWKPKVQPVIAPAEPAAPLHHNSVPEGATTILRAEQLGMSVDDFRIQQDGIDFHTGAQKPKTIISASHAVHGRVIEHAYPEATRIADTPTYEIPHGSDDDHRARLAKSLAALRLDTTTSRGWFE